MRPMASSLQVPRLRQAPGVAAAAAPAPGAADADADENDDDNDNDPRLRPDPTPPAPSLSSPDPWTSARLVTSIYAANLSIAGAATAAAATAAGASATPETAAQAAALLSTLAHGGQLGATVALLRWFGGVDWSGRVVLSAEAEAKAAVATSADGGDGNGDDPGFWWRAELRAWPAVQGASAAVVALGVGALVATASQGAEADGSLEWRSLLQMAGGGQQGPAAAAAASVASPAAATAVAAARFVGAVFLAPAWEELYCRGLLMAVLRPYAGELGAAAFSALFFAAALHPAAEFQQQLSLGLVLSLTAVAARGNLAAPFLGHALYNAGVLLAAAAVVAGGQVVAAGAGAAM